MQKNMAAILAFVVLVIAILLMVFFVLPSWQKGEQQASAPVADGTAPVETTTVEPPPGDDASQTTAKTDRPAGETGQDAASGQTAPADTPETAADAPATDGSTAQAPAATAGQTSAETGQPAATATETTTPADAAANGTQAPAGAESAAQETKPAGEAAAALAQAAADSPAFDILRVEPDGSAVIAGRAAPNTIIRILSGDKVLATAEAGPSGDFAAVLDQPLAPGDYQLVIVAVAKDGKEMRSDEVATVSVPAKDGGQLLAMVSKPGAASRLITTPEAGAGTEPVPGAEQAADASTAAAPPEAGTTAGAETAAPVDAGPAASDATTPATTSTEAPATAATAPAALQVAAVEIEGDRLFVAGKAKPGTMVRIYADDKEVGVGKADEAGNFVVDGKIALSVGSHVIRADMLTPDGSKVELRAAVPFDRPEGDQVAAVAGSGEAPGTAMAPLAGGSFDGLRSQVTKAFGLLKGLFANGALPGVEELAAARSATEIALGSLADFKAADPANAEGQAIIARTASAAAEALAKLRALPKDAAGVAAGLASIEQAIASVLAPNSGEPLPQAQSTPVAGAVEKPATTTSGETPAAEGAAQAPANDATPSDAAGTTTPAEGTTTPAASAGQPAAGETAAAPDGEPQTIQQAPLQQSKSSVIIRRGDTLWQISRRVYGAGVRYTTIYLANKEQIQDPDRILPGQIFGVPDKALSDSEAEQVHRKHLQE